MKKKFLAFLCLIATYSSFAETTFTVSNLRGGNPERTTSPFIIPNSANFSGTVEITKDKNHALSGDLYSQVIDQYGTTQSESYLAQTVTSNWLDNSAGDKQFQFINFYTSLNNSSISYGKIKLVLKSTGGVNYAVAEYDYIAPLTPGNVYNSQTIPKGGTPQKLSGYAPSGGNKSYSYQWQSSTNGTDWANVGGNSDNYQPGVINVKTYYKRKVASSILTDVSNTITIDVTDPITNNYLNPSYYLIAKGTIPPAIIGSTPQCAFGGTASYSWKGYTMRGNTPVAQYNLSNVQTKDYTPTQPVNYANNDMQELYVRTVKFGDKSANASCYFVSIDNKIAKNQFLLTGGTPKTITGTDAKNVFAQSKYQWQECLKDFVSGATIQPWEDIQGATAQNYQPDKKAQSATQVRYFRRKVYSETYQNVIYSNEVSIQILADISTDPLTPVLGELIVFPNPTTSIVSISYSGNISDGMEYQITNGMGITVLSGNLAPNQIIDVSSLPGGDYVVRVIDSVNILGSRVLKISNN